MMRHFSCKMKHHKVLYDVWDIIKNFMMFHFAWKLRHFSGEVAWKSVDYYIKGVTENGWKGVSGIKNIYYVFLLLGTLYLHLLISRIVIWFPKYHISGLELCSSCSSWLNVVFQVSLALLHLRMNWLGSSHYNQDKLRWKMVG